jgi:DNA polymerase III alpha subunit
MKNAFSSASGKITDYKLLETEKGKQLAHLQISDEHCRVSWVLVPAPVYKRAKSLIEKVYIEGHELEIQGKNEDAGSHIRLIAEQIFAREVLNSENITPLQK